MVGSRRLHCVSPAIVAQLGRGFPGLLWTLNACGGQGMLCRLVAPCLVPLLQIFCLSEVIYLSRCRVMIEVCYLAIPIKCRGAASSVSVVILRAPCMRGLPEEVLEPSPCPDRGSWRCLIKIWLSCRNRRRRWPEVGQAQLGAGKVQAGCRTPHQDATWTAQELTNRSRRQPWNVWHTRSPRWSSLIQFAG